MIIDPNAKIIDLDVETGGLDIQKSPILQISSIISVGSEAVESFNVFVKPFDGQEITPEALEKNRFTLEEIFAPDSRFLAPKVAFDQFESFLSRHVDRYNSADKLVFCGYNAQSFDAPILRRFFDTCGNKFFGAYFWNPTLDLMNVCSDFLLSRRGDYKRARLSDMVARFGIAVDETKLHDGAYDTFLVRELRLELTRRYQRLLDAAEKAEPGITKLVTEIIPDAPHVSQSTVAPAVAAPKVSKVAVPPPAVPPKLQLKLPKSLL